VPAFVHSCRTQPGLFVAVLCSLQEQLSIKVLNGSAKLRTEEAE
jgi:hypothetical protein